MFNNLSDRATKNFAKKLRRAMAKQEKHLWYDFLQKHRCKWYKQKPIGKYITDFYCGHVKLIVEQDGVNITKISMLNMMKEGQLILMIWE